MTLQIVVTEQNLGDACPHLRYIAFDLDDGKQVCYRSRVSYNAFAYSDKCRSHWPNKKNPQLIYHCQLEKEWQIRHTVLKEMRDEYPYMQDIYSHVPMIRVANLWEFYKLIGYDYKTKKWIDA